VQSAKRSYRNACEKLRRTEDRLLVAGARSLLGTTVIGTEIVTTTGTESETGIVIVTAIGTGRGTVTRTGTAIADGITAETTTMRGGTGTDTGTGIGIGTGTGTIVRRRGGTMIGIMTETTIRTTVRWRGGIVGRMWRMTARDVEARIGVVTRSGSGTRRRMKSRRRGLRRYVLVHWSVLVVFLTYYIAGEERREGGYSGGGRDLRLQFSLVQFGIKLQLYVYYG
jgi:hypothetical protein